MKKDRQLDEIVNKHAYLLMNSEETIDSILELHSQLGDGLRVSLEAVKWLGDVKMNLQPRQGFVASSRSHLEHQLATYQPEYYWHKINDQISKPRWVIRFAVSVLLITLLVLGFNSILLTAQLSIPGDPFYSSKLLIEDIHLAVTRNPTERAKLSIDFSRERTSEFVELVLNGDYEALPEAAARMDTEIITALHSISYLKDQGLSGELTETIELKETLSSEISMLTALKGSSPPSAYQGMDLAIQISHQGLMALR
jgi:hypothetical protein